MIGHDVFPGLSDQDDGSDEEVQCRFRAHQFPVGSHACSKNTAMYWGQGYTSAVEIVRDIEIIGRPEKTKE